MGRHIRKYWYLGVSLILGLILIFGLINLGLNNRNISESSTQKDYRLSIALVDEDNGGQFNDQQYNFGKNFVQLVTSDVKNNWTVTSRSIAENGLRHKRYEMMLVIPANFTEKTLQLQSANPSSANLEYKLNTTKNPLIRSQAERQVNNLLQTFNQRVINMYFSSVINNLHTAQNNVSGIVMKENQLNTALTGQVSKPFAGLSSQFGDVTSQGKSIESDYDDWKSQANTFTSEAKDSMTSVIDNGNTSLSALKDFNENQAALMATNKQTMEQYFKDSQEKQQEISDKNYEKLIANNTKALAAYQAQYDQSAKDYGILQRNMGTQLGVLNLMSGDQMDQGVAFKSLVDANNELKPALMLMNLFYTQQTNTIKNQSDQLNTLQEQLRTFFTGNKDGDVADTAAVEKHIRQDILVEIKNSRDRSDYDDPKVNQDTENLINQNIATAVKAVPDDAGDLIGWLKYFDAIDGDSSSNYQADIDLVNKYAAENKIKDDDRATATVFDKQIKDLIAQIKAKTDQHIYIPLDDMQSGQQVKLTINTPTSLTLATNQLMKDVKDQLSKGGYSVSAYDNTIVITAMQDTDAQAISVSPEFNVQAGSLPHTVLDDDTISVGYKLQLLSTKTSVDQKRSIASSTSSSSSEKSTGSASSSASESSTSASGSSANAESAASVSTSVATKNLTDNNQLTVKLDRSAINDEAKQKLKQLVPELTKVVQASSMINGYYGSADAATPLDPKSDQKLAEQAAAGSLYYSLENTSIDKAVATVAAKELAPGFIKEATTQDQALTDQINTLNKQAENTGFNTQYQKEIAAVSAQTDSIDQAMKRLVNWYHNATAYVNGAAMTPKADLVLDDTKLPLDLVKTPDLEEDTTSGPAIVKEFQEQLMDSQASINQTMTDAAKVKDMTPSFHQLQSTTTTLADSSKGIISNASGLTKDWNKAVGDHGDYSSNFKKVLNNTKNGQADNQKVYDYLADPVHMKNSGEITSSTSIMPYYLTLIMIMVALFTAYVLSLFEHRRLIKSTDKFTNTSSMLWQNTPWAAIIAAVGTVEGLIIGIATRSILRSIQVPASAWVMLVLVLQLVTVLIATYLLRQFKSVGMFVLLLLTALYLFFTPSLGIKIATGSATKTIAATIPFSWIETLLMKLSSGAGLSWRVYGGALVAALLGIGLNLIVKHARTKEKGREDDDAPQEDAES
ncbi:type VII secretion protein EsaA [Lacticaseibacillus pantheris]|uniref:type VII secretion protein EsaA n=1 Tax=Lacticaseibacillus pantheris TaxID=171523 RepID=UPI00265B580B|nr:type VII secretion protein EsaA [Lacticaseibacillus pantheris]WKF84408.1 type VII secretion protein EsaA [Lacticaseibacillus pantheris]